MIGATVVTLALLTYLIGVIKVHKKKNITKDILAFLSFGIFFDISATICMIIGSTNSPFTFHGFLGYSALLVMLIDIILIWKNYFKNGLGAEISKKLHRYTLIAYSWWVVAYITGSLLVALK